MLDGCSFPDGSLIAIGVVHRRRLRDVYRSAGWPCQDAVEIELIAAGLLVRERGLLGHELLRVSDAGIAVLAETLAKNRAKRDAHEQLVERVAREMTRAGRLAWRGLAVRARVGAQWQIAMPDVFSVRHTTVEAYLEPIVHEVKVRRSDLLADLRRASKREAYLQLGGECWYATGQIGRGSPFRLSSPPARCHRSASGRKSRPGRGPAKECFQAACANQASSYPDCQTGRSAGPVRSFRV